MGCRALLLAAVVVLAGCAPVATVIEVVPGRPGVETGAGDPLAALERHVEAAERAWQALDRDPADVHARRDYNYAVARIVGTLRAGQLTPWTAPIQLGSRTLDWEPHPRPVWDPRSYELIPTDQLEISGAYVEVRETRDGLGAPLVAKRVGDPVHEHAPTPHFFYAATAIARFEGSRCVLALADPIEEESVGVGEHVFPLAADFTAPLAMTLVEMHPEDLGLPRLLHPAKFARTTRIARLEPYDPNKTVVLLVHGLMSSPATWFPLINHLRADEDIRRHYQFWLFSYSTGYPYSYSAAILRRELDHIERDYPLRGPIVVIGHSMGGCIARLLVTDSERRIWDQMFTVSPEEMEMTAEHKHILTESTIFTHRPEVGRVVFVSAPLRGATLARNWIGRLAAWLIELPLVLVRTFREEARYLKRVAGHQHLDRFPDSIDSLSPDNDFVLALAAVPMKPGIPYHTIVGDRGRGDAPNSSDGVVPYWSSHVPEAESETIVPADHGAHQHGLAIAEIRRILILHANGW